MNSYKANRECAECRAILQQLAKASQELTDETRRDLFSSGKTLPEAHAAWLSSMTEMFQDEYRLAEWREAQPGLTAAWRRKAGHETATGHCIFLVFPPRR
jgi:hypothetical protein